MEIKKKTHNNLIFQNLDHYNFIIYLTALLFPQTLQRELDGHRGRVEEVLERAAVIASIRSPEAECVRAGMEQLQQFWEVLWMETEHRQLNLDAMYQVQQYYFDIAEVESWLSEQELHMMNEEKGKVGARTREECSGKLI